MDPEKPSNLEDLNVVCEEDVVVEKLQDDEFFIRIEFVPTVPHCSLAPLIGKLISPLCFLEPLTNKELFFHNRCSFILK